MDALARAHAHSIAGLGDGAQALATLEALLEAWRVRRLVELIAPIEALYDGSRSLIRRGKIHDSELVAVTPNGREFAFARGRSVQRVSAETGEVLDKFEL